MKMIKALWRRPGCVGGDCDALYPADGGVIATLSKISGEDCARLEHAPAAHEEAVFIPDDVIQRIRGL